MGINNKFQCIKHFILINDLISQSTRVSTSCKMSQVQSSAFTLYFYQYYVPCILSLKSCIDSQVHLESVIRSPKAPSSVRLCSWSITLVQSFCMRRPSFLVVTHNKFYNVLQFHKMV